MSVAMLRSWDWMRAEERLRSAYREGASLNLSELAALHNGYHPKLFGEARKTIRAEVIRELLLSDAPLPAGKIRHLDLTGAIICGPLDLRFARTECPLSLVGCTLDNAPDFREARLGPVTLRDCTLPGLKAGHVTIHGDLDLRDSHLTGPLRLQGACLEEDLHLKDAVIEPPGHLADPDPGEDETKSLNLAGSHIKGSLGAEHLIVRGPASTANATVDGSCTMKRAEIWAAKGTDAWDGDGMTVGADLDATGLQATGTVRLINARVLVLDLSEVKIENTGPALVLDRLESHGSAWCRGSKIGGGMTAIGMQIGQALYLNGLQAFAADGQESRVAVDLSRARITGELYMRQRFQATGTVNLMGARIGGRVLMNGATLRAADDDKSRLAFVADYADISADVWGTNLTCTGVMRLRNARIGGQLLMNGATLRAADDDKSRLAFVADYTDISADVRGTNLTCAGVMRLRNARIGGQLAIVHKDDADQDGSELDAPGVRVALGVDAQTVGTVNLRKAEVDGDIEICLDRLTGDGEDTPAADLSCARATVLKLTGNQASGKLDLTYASVRRLVDDHELAPEPGSLVLNGFEYDEIEDLSTGTADRLDWLKAGTKRIRKASGGYQKVPFAPQPYLQLAATYQRAGLERERRATLCNMYRERNRSLLRRHWYIKSWNYAQDWTLGYGYVPARALIWLAPLFVGASLWFTINPGKSIPLLKSSLMTLGLVLPGSGYDKLEKWNDLSFMSHIVGAVVVLVGLVLGATVIAALTRVLRQ